VLVYFGYPQAHEDDAERALRAGLELVEAISVLKTHPSSWPVTTRMPQGLPCTSWRSAGEAASI
jgi:hypothetical protein